MTYLHNQNIVHGDLKPQNLLLDAQNNIHISDFGIAHKLASDDADTSEQFQAGGTPAFMSPELVDCGINSGFMLDIWALGVTLYIML